MAQLAHIIKAKTAFHLIRLTIIAEVNASQRETVAFHPYGMHQFRLEFIMLYQWRGLMICQFFALLG